MGRLIAFGCSSTYGQGLPDCPTGHEPPSKYAWPSLLANKLNLTLVNASDLGSPNKKILLKILNFPFYRKDDLVVILWSMYHRGLVFEENGRLRQIMITDTKCEYSKYFYRVHSEYDLVMDTFLYINHVNQFLLSKGVRHFQFYFDSTINSYLEKKENKIEVNAQNIPIYHDLRIDTALDHVHVGVETQKKAAEVMLEKMKEANYV